MGLFAPIDFIVALSVGWLWYLVRTLPEIQVARSGLTTAAVCLLLLLIGLHYFLGWLFREIRATATDQTMQFSRWKWRWTLSLVTGVILLFAAGTATVGMTHQLGWLITSDQPIVSSDFGPRSAARRMWTTNNLKQIGLALARYTEEHQAYPPGGTFDRIGRPLQSWQTLILPYLEQEALYNRIVLTKPWNDASNSLVFQTEVDAYFRPGVLEKKNESGYALSHYAATVDMLGGDRPRALAEIADGTANTLVVGEVVSNFKPWGDPTNWRDPRLGLNRSPQGFGSVSEDGASFLFLDGSARFIKNSINPQILKALSTPAGHEKVSTDQY
jgi:hypothetical protein